jgi:hypothetical protein
MRWLLLDVIVIVAAVALLGLYSFRVWRKVAVVKSAAGELRDRLQALNAETAGLGERLDVAEVTARLAQRSREVGVPRSWPVNLPVRGTRKPMTARSWCAGGGWRRAAPQVPSGRERRDGAEGTGGPCPRTAR